MAKPVAPDPKKPYSAPKLTVYGTVRELTQSNGPRGGLDGGKRGIKTKTGLA
jgi:hypothetical protein